MKIVFYIATMEHEGGAERVMSVIANGFSARGDDVVLVNDFRYTGLEYAIDKRIERYYLTEDNRGSYLEKNIKRISGFRKLLKQIRPDVVISFLFMQNIRMILASTGLKTTKIISVRNDPKREFGENVIKRKLINAIYRQADGIVFQTEEEKEYFSDKIAKKSTIILNPVDEKFYDVKRDNNPKDILSIGRLAKQKNHKLLIDAFAQVRDLFPEEKLFIYGDGELKKQLEGYIKERGLSESIFLPGRISNVEDQLSKAKIFILSSDYEGLPNTIMEAMAVGVPVVSTDCAGGGPKTLIKNGCNGCLVECNNIQQMSDAIKSCLLNESILKKYSENAKKCSKVFKTDNIIEQWSSFIGQIKSNEKRYHANK